MLPSRVLTLSLRVEAGVTRTLIGIWKLVSDGGKPIAAWLTEPTILISLQGTKSNGISLSHL
jgi:hypothetical protein